MEKVAGERKLSVNGDVLCKYLNIRAQDLLADRLSVPLLREAGAPRREAADDVPRLPPCRRRCEGDEGEFAAGARAQEDADPGTRAGASDGRGETQALVLEASLDGRCLRLGRQGPGVG